MLSKPSASIGDADFEFENTPVKTTARRDCPEIKLAGLEVGPLEEGKEYEFMYWIARELGKAGIVHLHDEETLDAVKLHKIHWKERVQSAKQIISLSEDFYPRLRRYLASQRKEAIKKPEKMKEYNKAKRLSRDIINCRLKKIISLASAPKQTNQTLNNLTREEYTLHEQLNTTISSWRGKILEGEGIS
ncbi:MAG: DNA replication complex GINS family protein [Candidatus Bathyarchaeota archaeon]|nr:MAG: DNA replication complex GINS family protein [Candidatus Bathyarchaeota archaeon]